MKNLSLRLIGTLAVAVGFVLFTGCKDDEDPTVPDTPTSDEKYDSKTTTDKEWMEQTGIKVLNLFNANDQKPLIELVNDFTDLYGDYTFDDIADAVNDSRSSAVSRSLKSLAADLRSYNYYAASRSTENYTINMARIKGIYKPNNRGYWQKVEESNDAVLQFKDYANRECSITVSGSNDTWNDTHTYGDRDDQTVVSLEIPKTLTLKIDRDGTTLASATIKTDFADNQKLNINAGITMMNLVISDETRVTPSTISESLSMSVGGQTIVNCTVTGEGRNLLSLSKWEDRINNEDFKGIAQSGEATINIMGRVTIKANVTDPQCLIDNIGEYWDKWDSNNPETSAKTAANALVNALDAKVYFNGVSDPQAYIGWEAYCSDERYNEWETRPIINFYSGGKYDVESYFGNGRFASVEDLFENLSDSYEAIWR